MPGLRRDFVRLSNRFRQFAPIGQENVFRFRAGLYSMPRLRRSRFHQSERTEKTVALSSYDEMNAKKLCARPRSKPPGAQLFSNDFLFVSVHCAV